MNVIDIIVILSIIPCLVILMLSRKESYKLLHEIGMTNNHVFKISRDEDSSQTLKYTGHRYDRQKQRRAPGQIRDE